MYKAVRREQETHRYMGGGWKGGAKEAQLI